MKLLRAISVATLICAGSSPAGALTFNFTVLAGDTLSSSQAAAFTTAANAWSSKLTDNFTVNLKIGFRSLATGVLGQTAASYFYNTATQVIGLLAMDATSLDDVSAVTSLANVAGTGSIAMTSAQTKAIGGIASGDDGIIEFSSNYNFSTARDSNGGIEAGTYDLVGIAEHEIGHVLGFGSTLDTGLLYPTLLDEFRYAGAGTRSFSAGSNAYFSIDGGVTGLSSFAVGGSGNDQASHWLRGTTSGGGNALMDPAIAPGATQNITPLDLRAFDVIGYNLATDVPEPATFALLLPMILAVAGRRQVR